MRNYWIGTLWNANKCDLNKNTTLYILVHGLIGHPNEYIKISDIFYYIFSDVRYHVFYGSEIVNLLYIYQKENWSHSIFVPKVIFEQNCWKTLQKMTYVTVLSLRIKHTLESCYTA